MAKRSNTSAMVILTVLALSGLGLSGYMFIEDQLLGGREYIPDHIHEFYTLVGYWDSLGSDSLGGGGEMYNLTFSNNTFAPNEYVSMIGSTTINLTQIGWYRFTIATVFIDLEPLTYYYIRAYRNITSSEVVGYIEHPYGSAEHVEWVYYCYSDGGDLIRFLCESSPAESFSVVANDDFNRASLEYLRQA